MKGVMIFDICVAIYDFLACYYMFRAGNTALGYLMGAMGLMVLGSIWAIKN